MFNYPKILSCENCAVLRYYAASSGNSLPTFWNNDFLRILEPWRWDWWVVPEHC